MNAPNEVSYRLALAKGFLGGAEQDLTLERWRSCVDNSQLAVENAGKTALSLFGVPPKTHDPVRQIAAILREEDLPQEIRLPLQQMLPDLLALGKREHILTAVGAQTRAFVTYSWMVGGSNRSALRLPGFRFGIATLKRKCIRI